MSILMSQIKWDLSAYENRIFGEFEFQNDFGPIQHGRSLFDKETPENEAIQNAFLKSINMNNPPGNPTEIETKLAELEAEVIAINESIKNQDHVIWLAKVEKSKQKAILNATLAAIEAITKPKE